MGEGVGVAGMQGSDMVLEKLQSRRQEMEHDGAGGPVPLVYRICCWGKGREEGEGREEKGRRGKNHVPG